MRKYFFTAIIAFFGGMLLLQPVQAAGGWSKIKDSSGIKLYERSVGDLMEYMAVGPIDAKIEVIGEALRDVAAYSKWLTDCFGAQIEKKYDKNTFVMYMVLKPPVIEERDIVLKNKTMYDYENGKALITFTCTDEVKIPLEKKRTRVTIMDGSFSMEYLGRNKTKFTYKLKVDPGGSIPKRVAYGVMNTYPFSSIKSLRDHMSNKKYEQAAVGSEEEKKVMANVKSEPAVRRILTGRLTKFVKNPAALTAVIAADKDGINSIMKSGGQYANVEKTTIDIFIKYAEKIMTDKKAVDNLKNNKKLIAALTEMIVTDCGVSGDTFESMVAKYK